ncbi:glutathione S-transferase [Rhodobacteraceae bacterium D3-12]|nr:glutathione S-transferase [Rhodobacteraceae bacterium D3-12]
MKLFHSPASPYVRKVMVLALETGQSVEKLASMASPIAADQSIVKENPTGKVPTAILDDGEPLYDSRVITRWLDAQHNGAKMYPENDTVWTVLRREALADGLLDAALLARYETAMRPAELLWQDWLDGQMGKINASLDRMEAETADFSGIDAGLIAIGCAIAYLDFRFADFDWRSSRPALTKWYETFAARPSMVDTAPE